MGALCYAVPVRRASTCLSVLFFLACGEGGELGPGAETDLGAEPPVADLGAADGAAPADRDGGSLAGTYLLRLDAGAFPPTPEHPSALVYIPPGFDPRPPLSVVVYIHGFNNCVENIVRKQGASCDPARGTPVRTAFSLAEQLQLSRRNALLLCPEVAFDQASADPGSLGKPGGFKALLGEALQALPPPLRDLTPREVGDVVLASHSGGYQAAAGIAVRGGVPIRELYLFDSLYGSTTDFDAWVQSDVASFSSSAPRRRFADVYTTGGGTLARSQAMADRARAWAAADPGALVDDRTTSTWPDATYRHGLLFKLSELSHDGVPRYYFSRLLQTSALPAIATGP